MASAWGLSFGAAWADAWGVVLEDQPVATPPKLATVIPIREESRASRRRTPAIPLASLRPVDHSLDDEEVLLMVGGL